MSHVPGRLAAAGLATLFFVSGAVADGKLEGTLKVEQAVRANLLPFSPSYVSGKCLVPYPLCKLAFATISLVTGWEGLLLGGDVAGAASSLKRGLGGPWVVRPENVTGEALWSTPPPVPLVGYFVTGRSNDGPVPLDPLGVPTKSVETEGDVLPP